MKRVLVTGANGFIGKHTLYNLLERGYEVHGVCGRNIPFHDPIFQWHRADLLDNNQVKELVMSVRATHLLHLSWYTKPGEYWSSLENYDWVQSSFQLAKSFFDWGGTRLVTAGSCMEYDWRQGFLSEQDSLVSYSAPYASCKNHLRGLLQSYSERINCSSAWGRIFFLYGPYEQQGRLVPSVINSLLRGEDAKCSHGNQIRDFLYVKDVANAFVSLLDSDVQGTVNISSGKPVRLKEIVYEIADQLGAMDKVRLGAISVPHNESPIVVGNNDRLRNEVGWQPKYDLKQGLQKTIAWWRTQVEEDV